MFQQNHLGQAHSDYRSAQTAYNNSQLQAHTVVSSFDQSLNALNKAINSLPSISNTVTMAQQLQPQLQPTHNREQKIVDLKYILEVRRFNEARRDGTLTAYWTRTVPVLSDIWAVAYEGVKGIMAGLFDDKPDELIPLLREYLPVIQKFEIPVKITEKKDVLLIPKSLFAFYGFNPDMPVFINARDTSGKIPNSNPIGPIKAEVVDEPKINWEKENPFQSLDVKLSSERIKRLLALRTTPGINSEHLRRLYIYNYPYVEKSQDKPAGKLGDISYQPSS